MKYQVFQVVLMFCLAGGGALPFSGPLARAEDPVAAGIPEDPGIPTAKPEVTLPPIDHDTFMERLEKRRPEKPPNLEKVNLKLGDELFVDMEELIPGQFRYSLENALKHLREYVADFGVTFTEKERKPGKFKWELPKGADGKLFSLKDAVPVVLTDKGYVLLDGHHHALACLYVGCKEFPVYIAADVRGKSKRKAARIIREMGFTNYRGIDDEWHRIRWFSRMEEDRMLMFVREMRARIVMAPDGALEAGGSDRPAWVAFRGDPYSEIKVADALRESGFRLPENYDGKVTEALREEVRRHLIKHVEKKPGSLPGIEIVREPMNLVALDVPAIYRKHLGRIREHPCIPYFREVADFGPFLEDKDPDEPKGRLRRMKEKTGRK